MLLERLYDQAPPDMPKGYQRKNLQCVLTITPKGEHVSMEVLAPKNAVKTVVPASGRSSNIKPAIGIDNFIYMFGCGQLAQPEGFGTERLQAWRSAAEQVSHPGFAALLKYIDNPNRPLFLPLGAVLTDSELAEVEATPAKGKVAPKKKAKIKVKNALNSAEHRRAFLGVIADARANHPNPNPVVQCLGVASSATVLVRVQGMGDWWLDPAVRKAHQRLLFGDETEESTAATTQEVTAKCALTHQEAKLATLFPDSNYKNLVSFNFAAVESYGFKQASNAPVSEDAAAKVAQGLADLMDAEGTMGTDCLHMVWAHDRSVSGLAGMIVGSKDSYRLAEKILKGEVSFAGKTFTYLCQSYHEKRVFVRDYFDIPGEDLERNLRQWLQFTAASNKEGKSYVISTCYMAQELGHGPKKPDAKLLRALVRVALLGETLHIANARKVLQYVLKGNRFSLLNQHPVARSLYKLLCHQKGIPVMPDSTENLVDASKPSDPKLYKAYVLGCLFHYGERLQMARSNRPNKSMYEKDFAKFLSTPRKGWVSLRTTLARVGWKYTEQLLANAGLSGGDATGMDVPSKFSDDEQMYFIYGYDVSDRVQRERRAAAKAKKSETKN